MTTFRFNPVTPHPLLRPFVAKMWVFESSGCLPVLDNKLIVPNGNLKLALTYLNGLVASITGESFVQNESEISLTGLVDTPVNLDPREDSHTGTIVIEFNPLGAYRLFRLSYAQIKNQIVDLTDLVGNPVKELRSKLAETNTVDRKLKHLEDFLIKQLEKNIPDAIYDYCINRIAASKGLITVAQLEKETGYSSRWLHTKFSERLGTGPKNLCEIYRFRMFYQVYSSGADLHSLKKHIYEFYYDQSHFIRSFKRFTGFTPTDLQNSVNELATRHYRG